ncbi:aminotransferase class V-fold PLP-dependent enzyme [Luedemannella flava]|uniref:Aminotransferase class V-fold PLP-dependent enzyme n=1 Tax=Luedemannella flava TaxID=349316 RepID=A0ABN2LK33_9ACTN
MDIESAQHWWQPVPGWLNTASYGLPPQQAIDELAVATDDWRTGRVSWEGWDTSTARARAAFARIVGVDATDVAVGSQVSQLLAPVAAAIPDRSRVVCVDIDFTSNLFPWMVHADRGVRVRTVPVSGLVEAAADADVVAFSLVQSATGEVADYTEVCRVARAAGALTVVDATQACGWLPFDAALADVVVVGAYKWLMSPRGTGFAYLSPEVRDRFRPIAAGWYAGDDPHGSYYGLPLRLATTARRFDISPAWLAWVGTAPALEVVEQLGVAAIHDHDLSLANRFRAGLGLPPGDSAIVCVDVPGAEDRLAAAGVRAAVRAGRVRASFHVYNTVADVDLALAALTR